MLKSLLSGLLHRGTAQPTVVAAPDELAQAIKLMRNGDNAGAAQICERLLEHDPKLIRAWELLAVVAMNLGDEHLACTRFEQVLALDSRDPQHFANAAEANRQADRSGRALELIERAIALDGGNAEFLHIRVLALRDCFRHDEALAACRAALAAHPDFSRLHAAYVHMLNCAGAAPVLIRDAHCEWAMRIAGERAAVAQHENSPQPDRRLRIGYVSADFRRHAISDFLLPILEHHDRAQFEVYCYSNTPRTDEVSRRCEDLVSHWRDITEMPDEEAGKLVRADGIDLLIDLSGHTAGNRLPLFARKPAPVQITYLGYPGTTGLAEMDYRITDSLTDPPGASDSHYREALLRVPHSLWCYQAPETMPELAPAPFLQVGHITFGSLNAAYKLTHETIALWSRLLLRLPQARLLMAGVSSSEARERIVGEFQSHGVPPNALSIYPTFGREEFWALHKKIDIALDSFPYNGGATTCATLWLGVPVIGMKGNLFQSRAGFSILATLGMQELVAETPDDFLRIAVELACDPQRLAELHTSMRSRMQASPLTDCVGYTRALESIYRTAWQRWCAVELGNE